MNRNAVGALCLCGMALICFLILRGASAFCEKRLKTGFQRESFRVFIVFALALLTRFFLILPFQNFFQPFSDFRNVWEIAHGNLEKFAYYTLFPAYLNFAAFEKIFLSIFGDRFANLLYLNILLAGFTSALIYWIARLLKLKEQQAMLSALLYAFMPANAFYCAIGAPDFLCIFFNVIGAALLLIALNETVNDKKYLWALCGGLCIGIGSAYKTFGLVILIAFFMTLALRFLCAGMLGKRFLTFALCFFLAFGAYKITLNGITNRTESDFNVRLDFSASTPHFLLIGLNTEGEGQIHIGTLSRIYANEYLSNGQDAKAAAEVARRVLLDDWSQNAKKLPSMFANKMVWVWQDDAIPLWYFINEAGINANDYTDGWAAEIYSWLARFGGSMGELFYFFLMLFGTLGCLTHVRMVCGKVNLLYIKPDEDERKTPDFGILFLLLTIFGYFCMTFLAEGQSRYKNLIMPFICLISGYGIRAAFQRCARLLNAMKK